MNKYFFDSKFSPVKVGVHTGDHNIGQDWLRLSMPSENKPEKARVDGIPLEKIVEEGKYGFTTADGLKRFFKEVILAKAPYAEDYKDRIIDEHLVNSFHQGGYMYPISAAMATFLGEKIPTLTLAGGKDDVFKEIDITTTEEGFKIQEIFISKKAIINVMADGTPESIKNIANDEGAILPPPEEQYVIKGSALIALNFSQDPKEPQIIIEDNYISYGVPEIKKIVDIRNPLEILIDFFRNILGLNAVSITETEETKTPRA